MRLPEKSLLLLTVLVAAVPGSKVSAYGAPQAIALLGGGAGGQATRSSLAAAAKTPPSDAAIRQVIVGKASLKQALDTAVQSLGLDPTKARWLTGGGGGVSPRSLPVLIPRGPKAPALLAQTPTPIGGTVLGPCDWKAGVWLTYRKPVAAPSWPSSRWAYLKFIPWPIQVPLTATSQQQMATFLPATGDVMAAHMGPLATDGVWVSFIPDVPGVYTVTLTVLWGVCGPPDPAVQPFVVTNAELVGSTVSGQLLIMIVKIDQARLGAMQSIDNAAAVQFNARTGSTMCAIGGAKIQRMAP